MGYDVWIWDEVPLSLSSYKSGIIYHLLLCHLKKGGWLKGGIKQLLLFSVNIPTIPPIHYFGG